MSLREDKAYGTFAKEVCKLLDRVEKKEDALLKKLKLDNTERDDPRVKAAIKYAYNKAGYNTSDETNGISSKKRARDRESSTTEESESEEEEDEEEEEESEEEEDESSESQ